MLFFNIFFKAFTFLMNILSFFKKAGRNQVLILILNIPPKTKLLLTKYFIKILY